MGALQTSVLLLLLCLLSPMQRVVSAESVGDEVCIVGYIMDNCENYALTFVCFCYPSIFFLMLILSHCIDIITPQSA